MERASKFFTDFEKKRIEEAVTDAELKTSAEIVPAVATASGRYDRAEDIVGLWVGTIAMAVIWWVLDFDGGQEAQWGSTLSRFELPLLIAVVVLGFLLGEPFLVNRIDVLLGESGSRRHDKRQRCDHRLFGHTTHPSNVRTRVRLNYTGRRAWKTRRMVEIGPTVSGKTSW